MFFSYHMQILQQMKADASLLTLEGGGLPIPNPSSAAEDARLASLISLDGILTQVKVGYLVYVDFLFCCLLCIQI